MKGESRLPCWRRARAARGAPVRRGRRRRGLRGKLAGRSALQGAPSGLDARRSVRPRCRVRRQAEMGSSACQGMGSSAGQVEGRECLPALCRRRSSRWRRSELRTMPGSDQGEVLGSFDNFAFKSPLDTLSARGGWHTSCEMPRQTFEVDLTVHLKVPNRFPAE